MELRNIFAVAAATLALASCNMVEVTPDEGGAPAAEDGEASYIELVPSVSKASWKDGDKYIAWEDDDKLAVFQKLPDQTGFKSTGGYGTTVSMFTYVTDSFSAKLAMTKGTVLYAAFPYSAISASSWAPTGIGITIPQHQSPTQNGFDMAADILVMEPYTLEKSPTARNTTRLTVNFAHLSSFICFSFDDPIHGGEKVLNAELVSGGKPLAGSFIFDATKSAFSPDAVSSSYSNLGATIVIPGGDMLLKDFKGWFATMPMEYEDLRLVVTTSESILTYDLGTRRLVASQLWRKTLKEPTTEVSTRIVLKDNMMWEHIPDYAYEHNFSYTNRTAIWPGSPAGDTSETRWDVTYEGEAGYPSVYSLGNVTVDQLNSSSAALVDPHTGTIYLTSENVFEGIKRVVIQAGLYESNTSAQDIDAAIYLVNGDSKRLLKSFTARWAGDYMYEIVQFDSPEYLSGQLQFAFNEGGKRLEGRVCVRHLSVNQAPRITFGTDDISLRDGLASEGSVPVTVEFCDSYKVECFNEDGTPASWLHAEYDLYETTLNYAIDANPSSEERRGRIRVTGTGLTENYKEITVFQYGAGTVQREYVLRMEPADLKERSEAGHIGTSGYNETYHVDKATVTIVATATDGSGKTKDVDVVLSDLYFNLSEWENGGVTYHNDFMYFGDLDDNTSYGYAANKTPLPGITGFRFQAYRIMPIPANGGLIISQSYVPLYFEDFDLTDPDWSSLTLIPTYNSSAYDIIGQTVGADYSQPTATLKTSWLVDNGRYGAKYFNIRRGSSDLPVSIKTPRYLFIEYYFDVVEDR